MLKKWVDKFNIPSNKYLLILITIYFSFFLFINPLKQAHYIVGDEWSSFRQIEAFQKGIYRLNSAKDTSFILQGVMSYLTTFIVKDNFLAVRILNLITSLIFCTGLYFLSKSLTDDPKKSFLVSLLIIFNPIIYFLSFTFYSEIYLLTLLVWSIYFFDCYYKVEDRAAKIGGVPTTLIFLIFAALLSGASILVRQQGIIIPAVFCLLTLFKNFKQNKKAVLIVVGITTSFVLIYGLWPIYLEWNKEYLFSGFVKLLNKKTEYFKPKDYYPYFFTLLYFGFFAFPFVQKTKLKIHQIVGAILISYIAFIYGNFPIGNIFSLAGYFVKDQNIEPISLFNNVVFKIFISLIQGFGTVYLLATFKKLATQFNALNNTQKLLLISAILYFVSNFYIADVYDRYLVLPFTFLMLAFAKNYLEFNLNLISKVTLVILIIISFLLTYEFVQTRQIEYKMAFDNPKNISKLSRIQVTEEFGKYIKSKEVGDYTGLIYPHPEDKFQCTITKIYPNTIKSNQDVLGYTNNGYREIKSEVMIEPTKYLLNVFDKKSSTSKIKIYCK